jgi:hypothetical protein
MIKPENDYQKIAPSKGFPLYPFVTFLHLLLTWLSPMPGRTTCKNIDKEWGSPHSLSMFLIEPLLLYHRTLTDKAALGSAFKS